MEDKSTAKLSKAVLDMKFMKKTKERVDKEQEDAEGQAMYSKEITDKMKEGGKLIFMEASIMNCKDLIEGRLSFGGMNPDIEFLMRETYNRKLEEVARKKEKDISDVEMAKEYSSLGTTMGKNFKTKKQRRSKQFQKPPDVDTL